MAQSFRGDVTSKHFLKKNKAMSVYDTAISRMTIENDLKTDNQLKSWADEGSNCDNPISYFKALDRSSCEFKTADGVYWDITDITNPLIALSKKDLKTAQQNGTDGRKSFKFVTSYDTSLGTFRVDDIAFEKSKLEVELVNAIDNDISDVQDNIKELEKIFGFTLNINIKSKQPYKMYSTPCSNKNTHTECYEITNNGQWVEYYDEEGKRTLRSSNCTNGRNCKSSDYLLL